MRRKQPVNLVFGLQTSSATIDPSAASTHATAPPAPAPDAAEVSLSNDAVQHDLFGVYDVQAVPLVKVAGLHGLLEPKAELCVSVGHEALGTG